MKKLHINTKPPPKLHLSLPTDTPLPNHSRIDGLSRSDSMSLLKAGYRNCREFSFGLSCSHSLYFFLHSLWRGVHPRHMSSPNGGAQVAKNWSLLESALCMNLDCLAPSGNGSPDWQCGCNLGATTTQLSHAWIPEPQKLSEIIDVCS